MSVISRLPCPQCNYQWAFWECERNQEYVFCPRCGYEEHIWTDGSRSATRGYGAYRIACKQAPDRMGCFHKPVGPEIVTWFQQVLSRPGVDPRRSCLTRWDETQGKVEVIMGKSKYLTM